MSEPSTEPTTPTLQNPNPTPPPKNTGRWFLVTALVIFVLIVIVGGVYFVYARTHKKSVAPTTAVTATPRNNSSAPVTSASNTSGGSTNASTLTNQNPTPIAATLNSETVAIPTLQQPKPETFNLYLENVQDGTGNEKQVYFDAGTVPTGSYARYHIIKATGGFAGPGGPDQHTFITQDYKTFLLDQNDATEYNQSTTTYSDPSPFNKSVVTGLADLSAVPQIPAAILAGNFVLVSGYLAPSAFSLSSFDSVPSEFPHLDKSLGAHTDTLQLFSEISPTLYGNNYESESKNPTILAANQYLGSTATVVGVDAYGIAYEYQIMTKESYYAPSNDPYAKDPTAILYQSGLTDHTNMYPAYGNFLNDTCAIGVLDIAQNINSSNDLVPVTTTKDGTQLYALKNPNHPLIQAQYYVKVGEIDADSKLNSIPNEFSEVNKGATEPTYQQYVAQNPVLLFQDPFGRWIVTGEVQYATLGECGKPVIYLYPTKPIEVHVQFEAPINLTTDIPTYANGWDVFANPDGQLKDLQPQDTNCSGIDASVFGSGYAVQACKAGIYPYLYWEGKTTNKYPQESKGWIVSKNDLASFMNNTLDSIGFTAQEKSDMTSYWVPEMLKKDVPYYHISFFQTAQMDQFIPMKVTPHPQSIYRLFLNWAPLNRKPSALPQPETLNHVVRNGFTLVEWGGLKQ